MRKFFGLFLCFFIVISICMPSFAIINTANLNISSGACILVENSTGKVIYEKNSKDKMYPASTTKIMTALIALEKCNLNDVATVSKTAINSISPSYATVYLNEGEELTIEQLLNILLIPSGNIVGNILAEHISGSYDGFVRLMNAKAKDLGCVNTHFTNTYGLHDDNHYSCAYDLYLIAKEAMKYDIFRSIVSKPSYELAPTNKYTKDVRTFYNTNDLIKPNSSKRADNYYYEYAIGIKTGYTSQAKDCLVAAASKDGVELICVVLGAGKTSNGLSLRFTETKKLFNFAYENYFLRTLNEKDSMFKQIEIKNATRNTMNLDVLVKDDIVALVDKDEYFETITPNVIINDNLQAPLYKGYVIGHISYNIQGLTFESDLIAGNDVEKSYFMFIVIGAGVIGFIIALIVFVNMLKKEKNKKKVKVYHL